MGGVVIIPLGRRVRCRRGISFDGVVGGVVIIPLGRRVRCRRGTSFDDGVERGGGGGWFASVVGWFIGGRLGLGLGWE